MVFTKVWWVAANNQHGMGLTYFQNNYIISQIYVDSLNVWEMVSVFNIFLDYRVYMCKHVLRALMDHFGTHKVSKIKSIKAVQGNC